MQKLFDVCADFDLLIFRELFEKSQVNIRHILMS